MMFEDLLLEDMTTGSSLKHNQYDTQEFSDECMRVTTTEVNDIFDDEIWNPSTAADNNDP